MVCAHQCQVQAILEIEHSIDITFKPNWIQAWKRKGGENANPLLCKAQGIVRT